MGAVVMVLSLTQQLSEKGYYWHNLPKDAGFPFLAMCEHTNFVSPEHFGGDHLIYCGDYLSPDHEYFRLTVDELLDRFAPALPRFNPHFDRSWIKKVWLFRETYAQPIPPINHSRTSRTFARRSRACTSRRCRKCIRGIAAPTTPSRLAAARPG